MALTGKVVPYKAGFGPFPPEVYHAPFPIEFHGVTIGAWANKLQKETGCVGDVRIMGAMCAIEFVGGSDPDQPNADLTKAVAADALAKGVLLLTCGVRRNVIRFLPPLTNEPELLAEALEITGTIIRRRAGAVRKAS